MNLFMISILLHIVSADIDSAVFPLNFRSVNSIDNNPVHRSWGAAGVFFQRLTHPVNFTFDNLPGPRTVSNLLFFQGDTSVPIEQDLSSFLWAWAEFIYSDMVCLAEAYPPQPFPIEMPSDDPLFDSLTITQQVIAYNRSEYICFRDGVHQQINKASSFIDGSMLYGNDSVQQDFLRVRDGSGRLKPFTVLDNTSKIHTKYTLHDLASAVLRVIFIKEHNYWCTVIATLKSKLTDDDIYRQARAIVSAEIQAITYREFLPALLGQSSLSPYSGYDQSINPTISNEFSQGFDLLIKSLVSTDEIYVPQSQNDLPDPIPVNDFLVQTVCKALCIKRAEQADLFIIDDLRNHLVEPENTCSDAAAVSVQRSRDHQIPLYNEFRAVLGLPPVNSMSSLTSEPVFRSRIASVYQSYNQMELWPAALAENHIVGVPLGITLYKLLKKQFRELRDGDRFFYLRYMPQSIINLVEKRTLSEILYSNSGLEKSEIPPDVFHVVP